VRKIIEEVDFNGDGKIGYTEFLAATLDPLILKDTKKLEPIFSMFDTDNSGFITEENMYRAL